MEPWEVWIRGTALSTFVLDNRDRLWPALETLHFIGLSLLIGTVGLFDLRVLGLARAVPPMALHRLIPLGIAGYVLNVATGTLFFFGFPDQYAYNSAFHFKLAFMAIAGLNMVAFYTTAFAEVRTMPAGGDAPLRAKVITGISLGSWLGVLVCGRLLTFFRPEFMHH